MYKVKMNYKKLLIPLLIVLLTYISWMIPWTRHLWDIIDLKTFNYLNTWVQSSPFWQNFWAFTGHRIMDWIHDGLMLLFFLVGIIKVPIALKKRKIAELIFCACFIALVISLVNGMLFPEFIHMPRKSPKMVDPEAFRLSSVIEWTKVKDHSRKSFPGDHGTTAALFACLIFHLKGRKIGLLALAYAVFFCLPRLVVGAHWLTDTLIGSASIGILATSLAFGTPLAATCIQWIEKLLQRTNLCVKPKTITKQS